MKVKTSITKIQIKIQNLNRVRRSWIAKLSVHFHQMYLATFHLLIWHKPLVKFEVLAR